MLRLADIMRTDVLVVSPDITLRELVDLLTEHEVSGAPVVAASKVVGVISTTDILQFREESPGISAEEMEAGLARRGEAALAADTVSESLDAGEAETVGWMRNPRSREWDLLDEYIVSDLMTRNVVSQPSSTIVRKAAKYMLDSGVHRLLVIDGGELRGIVTTTDIVRAVAEGRMEG